MSDSSYKPKRVVRTSETAKRFGVSDRQIRTWEGQGIFPRRFTINPDGRATFHDEDQLEDLIRARMAGREWKQPEPQPAEEGSAQ